MGGRGSPGRSQGLKGGAPKGGPRTVGDPKFRAFFPPPVTIFFLSSSRGIFASVLKCRDPHMCTFGVFGLSCEAPRRMAVLRKAVREEGGPGGGRVPNNRKERKKEKTKGFNQTPFCLKGS